MDATVTIIDVECKNLKLFEHLLRMADELWPKRNVKWKLEGINQEDHVNQEGRVYGQGQQREAEM